MKLLAIHSTEGACGQYRIKIPYQRIKDKGLMNVDIRDYKVQYDYNFLSQYDIILFQRVHEQRVIEMMVRLKNNGKIVGMDIDDDLNSIERSNPSYDFYYSNDNRIKIFNDALRECDFIHTTTPLLKDKLSSDLNILPSKIHCLNNALNVNSQYYINKRKELPLDKVTFGFQGGATHRKDLELIHEVVREILNKHKNALFLYCSTPSDYVDFKLKLPQAISIPQTQDFNSFLSIPSYFDIGLAPLQYNEFNQYKSYLKVLEYGIYKSPTICSNIGDYKAYSELNKEGVVLVENNYKNWYDGIESMILNQEKRQRIGEKAYHFLFESESLDNINQRRIEFYEGVYR